MLLVFIIGMVRGGKLILVKGNDVAEIEDNLTQRLGIDYLYMYDYSYVDLGNLNIVFPKIYERFSPSEQQVAKARVSTESSNDSISIIQSAIDYLKDFTYVYNQSNPNKARKTSTGNCHSMSLMFKDILDSQGVPCDLVLSENHLTNRVNVDGVNYIVDLANGSITME